MCPNDPPRRTAEIGEASNANTLMSRFFLDYGVMCDDRCYKLPSPFLRPASITQQLIDCKERNRVAPKGGTRGTFEKVCTAYESAYNFSNNFVGSTPGTDSTVVIQHNLNDYFFKGGVLPQPRTTAKQWLVVFIGTTHSPYSPGR